MIVFLAPCNHVVREKCLAEEEEEGDMSETVTIIIGRRCCDSNRRQANVISSIAVIVFHKGNKRVSQQADLSQQVAPFKKSRQLHQILLGDF